MIKDKAHSLDAHNFGELSKKESDPRARVRLLILHQYAIGESSESISKTMATSKHTVMKTRRNYWQKGLLSIYDKARTGRKPKLLAEDVDRFKLLIVEAQEKREGGRLVCDDIVDLAKSACGVDYSRHGMYHVLKRIGMSWISARSQHPKADIEKQEAFKKTLSPR